MRRPNPCPTPHCRGSLMRDLDGRAVCLQCSHVANDPAALRDSLIQNVPTVQAWTAQQATGRTVPRLIERDAEDETLEAW